MTLLYTDPRFLDHDTGRHPERAERLRQITAHLDTTGLAAKCRRVEWQPVTLERLTRIHDKAYTESVTKLAGEGGGRIDPDTVVCPKSDDIARLAAGAVCDAVDRVLKDETKHALCLVRPPGHHALKQEAMGFCLFNNVAIAAKVATAEHKLDKVLIVDWDVHHGNGTQEACWTDGQIGFFSSHRWPFYPGSGRAEETGDGRGRGMIRNLPLEYGTKPTEFRDKFRSALEDLAKTVRPQLVIISAGFDAHREDPIGSLDLEVEDFEKLSTIVLDVAKEYAGGKVVSVLEGGYNPIRLAESVGVHLRSMLDREDKVSK